MHLLIVPPLFAFFFHTFFVFVYTRNHAGVFTVFTCIYVSVFWTGVSDSGSSCSLFSLLSQSILCTAGRRGVNNPLFQHRPQKSLAQIQNSTQLHIPDTDENTDTLLFSNVLTLAYAVPNTGHQPCLKSCFQENLISIWVPLFSVKIPASLNQQFFQHRLLCVLQRRPRWDEKPLRDCGHLSAGGRRICPLCGRRCPIECPRWSTSVQQWRCCVLHRPVVAATVSSSVQ